LCNFQTPAPNRFFIRARPRSCRKRSKRIGASAPERSGAATRHNGESHGLQPVESGPSIREGFSPGRESLEGCTKQLRIRARLQSCRIARQKNRGFSPRGTYQTPARNSFVTGHDSPLSRPLHHWTAGDAEPLPLDSHAAQPVQMASATARIRTRPESSLKLTKTPMS